MSFRSGSDDWLARAIRGEREAQRVLLERYGPMIYGLCRALDPDPDDSYQEIWEKAFRALPRFDPDGPAALSTWLYQIAHHHLVDRQRKRRVRSAVMPPIPEPSVETDAPLLRPSRPNGCRSHSRTCRTFNAARSCSTTSRSFRSP